MIHTIDRLFRPLSIAALVALLAVCVGALALPAAAADYTVTLQSNQKVSGPLLGLTDGKLKIGGEKPREVALDDVAYLEPAAIAGLVATWLGQDGQDMAQAGAAPGSNGIQDVHLRIAGLPRDRTLKQIAVLSKNPAAPHGWRLDPAESPHWRIGISQQAASGFADLYLEPDSSDAFGQTFSIELTYDNGATASVDVAAATHTNNQLAVPKPNDPAAASSDAPEVALYLASKDVLAGRLESLDDRSLQLAAAWGGSAVNMATTEALALRFGQTGGADATARFDKLRAAPPAADTLLVMGPDQAVAQIEGAVQEFSAGRLKVQFEGETRMIAAAKLVGVVFAARPKRPAVVAPYQVVQLANGGAFSGSWSGLAQDAFIVNASWKAEVRVPISAVKRIDFRNGRTVYLSDLEPVRVEETPYFTRRMPFQRDKSLTGGPLKMNGQTYARGLALHSRCILVYELGGAFGQFSTRIGFDEAALGRGRAAVRVLADERELLSAANLRGDAKPVSFEADIEGAKQLTLEVDFGEDEDIGDRVIFAEARLIRKR